MLNVSNKLLLASNLEASLFLLNPCILSLLRLKLHGLAYFFVGKSEVLHLFEGPE